MSTGYKGGLTSSPARYALALAAVCAAAIAAGLLTRLHGPSSVIVFIYITAIMATAWLGGYGPGILATLASGIAGPYLLNPHLTLARIDVVRLALILIISLLISKMADNRAKTEASLRAINSALDQRVRDRTEELLRANNALRDSQANLQQQAAELQRSNTDLARFAYVASHDMQEPLRMMRIYAELLEREYGGKLDNEAEQYLRIVVDGAVRLQRLVADLLDYSRLTDQVLDSHRPAGLNEIVRNAMDNLAQLIAETGARIHVAELPVLQCDPARVTQVFQNLLSNAIKYCRHDGSAEIEVSAELVDSEWILMVRDNGRGIKPEYHDVVFEAFKRLHGREISGTGIGLAICKRIVERHGGRIWVESEDHQGAAFKFSLAPPGKTVQTQSSEATV